MQRNHENYLKLVRVLTLLLFGVHVKIEDSMLLLEHSNLTRIIHEKC